MMPLMAGNDSFLSIGIGLASLFLGIFMIKAFFFVQTKYDVQDREVKPSEEPLLFDYLHQLADEIGAPRPHKVYLSNRVNASVFYDLSFLNLFFPSKKNLEIGLGLINILNLGEFKAVLAHEYGHFAQKSMLVGRWVYIANQIANTIITKRDALDSFLQGLSRFDFRVAWIGWVLSIIVWSIRSLVELAFRVVVLSQRALSREMEFQADLVAVSVTGSDALIHALHKLQAADAAFSEAMNTVNQQLANKKAVEDIYAIQTNAVAKTAYILNDKSYGRSPEVPVENPQNHRVFSDKIAQPPKMWATHPPDQEREANAKKRYISGEIDDRSAWVLFKDPQEIRLQLTADLIKTANTETEIISTQEVLAIHDKQFEKSYFNPKYKGIYLNRFLCQEYENIDHFYQRDLNQSAESLAVNQLYPEQLVEDLEDFTTLKEEVALLDAIKEKRLSASGESGIWHRGVQIRRTELPKVIEDVSKEAEAARLRIAKHDQLCRSTHLKLAEEIGAGWSEYLKGLMSLIHYAEHNILNINDAYQVLGKVLTIVMADNNVSKSELVKLIVACNETHETLYEVDKSRGLINLDQGILKELEVNNWDECVEKLGLGRADQNNINEWLQVVGGWVDSYTGSLYRLRSEALEVLLRTEDEIQKMAQSQSSNKAPAPSVVNADYALLMPGQERETNLKLNLWDKFISADGFFPALTKFAVAASIVGATVFMAGSTNQSDIYVYNGLGQSVEVNLNGTQLTIPPHSSRKSDISSTSNFEITSSTQDGEVIETFEPRFASTSSHYVYNIAGAAALYEYRMYYGGVPGDKHEFHSNKRWMKTTVDHILSEPPEQIRTSGSSATRDVLMGISNTNPSALLSAVPDENDQLAVIRAHVLWDPKEDPNAMMWINSAGALDDYQDLLKNRLKKYPNEIATARVLMDNLEGENRDAFCTEFSAQSESNPDNPDLFYIAARCMPDGSAQNQKFIAGAKKWPSHGWLAYGACYSHMQEREWRKANEVLITGYEDVTSLKEAIAMRSERIVRLLESKGKDVQRINDPESPFLQYLQSLDNGLEEEPGDKVYHLINKGNLQEALLASVGIADLQPIVQVLCAASDGAEKEWKDKAMEVSPEVLNGAGLISLTGLHLKRGQSIENLLPQLKALYSNQEFDIAQFIAFNQKGNYQAADQVIKRLDLSTQAEMGLLAYVAYGNKVPSEWKTMAKYALFAYERPYIK